MWKLEIHRRKVENWSKEKSRKAINSMNTAVGKGSALWFASSLDDNTYVAFYTEDVCNFSLKSPFPSQNGNNQPDTLLNKRLSSYVSMECWLHPSLKPKVVCGFFHRCPICTKLYGEGHGKKSNSWGTWHIFLASDLFVHDSHEMAGYCYPTARNSKSLWPLCTGKSTTLTFCARTVIDWSMEQISSNGLQIAHKKKIS